MEYPRKKIMVLAVLMEGLALLLAVFLAWYFGISLMPLSEDYFRDIVYCFNNSSKVIEYFGI